MIRRRRGKEQISTSHIERSFFQNQEEYLSFQDLDLEINFERSLLRSKLESYLKQTEINPKRLQSHLLDSPWHSLQDIVKNEENNHISQAFQHHITSPIQSPPFVQNLLRPMEAIFSPLAMPAVLNDFPQNYS